MTQGFKPAPPPDLPPDVPQPAQPAAQEAPQHSYWWYCLEDSHPNVPLYGQQPLDLRRIFGTDTDEGCPICPGCQRQVSAVPCVGPHLPPASVVEYAHRFANSQIVGGIGR